MGKEEFTITPYEVKGSVDYDRIVREFGVEKITEEQLARLQRYTGKLHHLLRRKIFFAHRDLNFALEQQEKKNLFLYTGCGPSGPIHIGHAVVWEFTKWLQEKLDLELYFQFTDDEKFLFKDISYEKIQEYMYDNMLDVI